MMTANHVRYAFRTIAFSVAMIVLGFAVGMAASGEWQVGLVLCLCSLSFFHIIRATFVEGYE